MKNVAPNIGSQNDLSEPKKQSQVSRPFAMLLCGVGVVSAIAFGSMVSTQGDIDETVQATTQDVVADQVEVEESALWEDEIKRIAATDNDPTTKHDEVMALAKEHGAEGLDEFFDDIVTEFLAGEYLQHTDDEVYMLAQLYKARSLDRYGSELARSGFADDVEEAKYSFSFDYLQNIKYVYRGVDDVGSASVIANERQMRDSLDVYFG